MFCIILFIFDQRVSGGQFCFIVDFEILRSDRIWLRRRGVVMGRQEVGGVCWQMVGMGLNLGFFVYKVLFFNFRLRSLFFFFRQRAVFYWLLIGSGELRAFIWVWLYIQLLLCLGMQGSNVGCFIVCLFKVRLDLRIFGCCFSGFGFVRIFVWGVLCAELDGRCLLCFLRGRYSWRAVSGWLSIGIFFEFCWMQSQFCYF